MTKNQKLIPLLVFFLLFTIQCGSPGSDTASEETPEETPEETTQETTEETPEETTDDVETVTIAFLGDQGLGEDSQAVLQLMAIFRMSLI